MAYEVTGQYYRRPWSIKNILELIPNVKLIAMLRNPVDAAYSNYNKNSILRISQFEDIIAKELQMFEKEKKKIEENGYSASIVENSVLARGLYAYQLEKWIKHFPREQILFVATEDLTNDHNKTFQEIFNFLKLPTCKIEYERKNIGKYKKEMKPETRKFLIDFYKPHNKKLYELLGKNFDWDK